MDLIKTVRNPHWGKLDIPTRRRILLDLESTCKKLEVEHKAEIPVKETLCEGVYTREVFIPKGTVLVGEIHKTTHISLLTKGKICVISEDGREILDAENNTITLISKAGTKRAGYTLEDSVWITIHKTKRKSIKKIKQDIISPSYELLSNKGK